MINNAARCFGLVHLVSAENCGNIGDDHLWWDDVSSRFVGMLRMYHNIAPLATGVIVAEVHTSCIRSGSNYVLLPRSLLPFRP